MLFRSESTTTINSNEALLVKLSDSVTTFTVQIDGELANSNYFIFNTQGQKIASGIIEVDNEGLVTFNTPQGESFQYISFDGAHEGQRGDKVDADFSIKPVGYIDTDGNSGLVGGTGDDTIVFDSTVSNIDGGDGFDTILVENTIDLSGLNGDNISNIEAINLAAGSQSISLSLEDVIGMTDEDNVLRIDGDSADNIHFDTSIDGSTWTSGTTIIDAQTSQTYNQYTNSADITVKLEISTDINVDGL